MCGTHAVTALAAVEVAVVVRDAADQEVLAARLTFVFVPVSGQERADGPTGRAG